MKFFLFALLSFASIPAFAQVTACYATADGAVRFSLVQPDQRRYSYTVLHQNNVAYVNAARCVGNVMSFTCRDVKGGAFFFAHDGLEAKMTFQNEMTFAGTRIGEGTVKLPAGIRLTLQAIDLAECEK